MNACLKRSGSICFPALFMVIWIWLGQAVVFAEIIRNDGHGSISAKPGSDASRAKIAEIQSEIDKIKTDLDWLSEKIKKMELFKQDIPEEMTMSLEYKRNRIRSLTMLRDRLKPPQPPVAPKAAALKTAVKKAPLKKQGQSVKKQSPLPREGSLIKERIKTSGLEDWLEVVSDKDGLRIENRLPLLFASGSAEVAEEYRVFLKNVAGIFKGRKVSIVVQGYTDPDPIKTEKYASNFHLGSARASNVASELIKNGLPPSAVNIRTTGPYRIPEPKASGAKALQRHVRLIFRIES